MKRIPLQSSDLKSVGYDEKTTNLEVEFNNETIYVYSRVPKVVYLELMNAQSHGTYFRRKIKDNLLYSCCQTHPVSRKLRG